jgi:hypothetical protein
MPTPTKLSDLLYKLARLMSENTIKGVPDSNLATTTFGENQLSPYPDDYFNDYHGRTYEGTHRGSNFVVTDFATTAGVVTVKVAQAVAYDKSDKFFMLPDYPVQDLIDAINLAISMVETEALESAVDDNLKVISGVFEYDVPKDFHSIEHIIQEASTADQYRFESGMRNNRHWDILNGFEPKIWFDPDLVSLTAGRNLRIMGQKVASQLNEEDDDDTTLVPTAYLLYQAKANLHSARADDLKDEHQRKYVLAQNRADMERVHVQVPARGRTVNE